MTEVLTVNIPMRRAFKTCVAIAISCVAVADVFGYKYEPLYIILVVNSISSDSFHILITIEFPATAPFNVGDKIYVEGLQSYVQGSGFNSEDYGYNFFTVSAYSQAGANDSLSFNMTGVATGISTTIVGVAKTDQNGFGVIINYNDYPRFKSSQVPTLI